MSCANKAKRCLAALENVTGNPSISSQTFSPEPPSLPELKAMGSESRRKGVETWANTLINAFQDPQSLPKALEQILIADSIDSPSRHWSILNRLAVYFSGYSEARGFNQWQQVGRTVKKGEKAISILVPYTKKVQVKNHDKESPDDPDYIWVPKRIGFTSAPVFGYEQTEAMSPEMLEKQGFEGDPYSREAIQEEDNKFFDRMPFVEVARAWGLQLFRENYTGYAYGVNMPKAIGMFTENTATWAHELIHAAERKLGALSPTADPLEEIVAEAGGAILLMMAGETESADLGGAYQYVQRFAKTIGANPVDATINLMDRISKAIDLIVEEASRIQNSAN